MSGYISLPANGDDGGGLPANGAALTDSYTRPLLPQSRLTGEGRAAERSPRRLHAVNDTRHVRSLSRIGYWRRVPPVSARIVACFQ